VDVLLLAAAAFVVDAFGPSVCLATNAKVVIRQLRSAVFSKPKSHMVKFMDSTVFPSPLFFSSVVCSASVFSLCTRLFFSFSENSSGSRKGLTCV
jgi:hypothetical protein